MPGNMSTVWAADGWVLEVAGVSITSGRGDENGEFLKREQDGEDWGYKGSASGFGTFYTKGKNLQRLSVTLPQTSPDNQKLEAIRLASLAARAPFPMNYKDGLGTSKALTIAAVIEKAPDETVATEPGTLVWIFMMHDPAMFVGGH
jgi:hypothetical protein